MAKSESNGIRPVKLKIVEPAIKDPAKRRAVLDRLLDGVKTKASIDFVRSVRGRR